MDGHKIMAINIMNPSKIYLSRLTLSIFLVACFEVYPINHIIKEENNFIEKHGPKLILKNLKKDGVFNTPSFEWTSSYDGFKLSNNVKGLFFEGLKYKGKSTKVFCWYGVPKNLKEMPYCPCGYGQSCIVNRRFLSDFVHEEMVFKNHNLPLRKHCFIPFSIEQEFAIKQELGYNSEDSS